MILTPTDWSEDIRERFKVPPVEGEPEYLWPYSYSQAHCGLCRRIVEPVAIFLARQDDWVDLDDVQLLTGFNMTTAVAVWGLIDELHPAHPPVRGNEHNLRLVAARNAVHGEIVAGVTEAVGRGGEFNPRVLNYVKAWSGTYADVELMPSSWSPLANPSSSPTYVTYERQPPINDHAG